MDTGVKAPAMKKSLILFLKSLQILPHLIDANALAIGLLFPRCQTLEPPSQGQGNLGLSCLKCFSGVCRSRPSLKISQRQPCSFAVSKRLWKLFSWISSGCRGIWKLWHCGCSTHSWPSGAHSSAGFAKVEVKAGMLLSCFALLGVLVSSGPNCIFHVFSEVCVGCK